ncbi:hypothetical protein K435DRAFT_929227 [Dendrothele bispora CBS 962.96]|uniref:Uncharacterized protein n=1 Tax=Dendrothele bispora (strain CBS 962.96) TaxID=1314807 RepID=A0A4S8L6F5_DENBC|nr:hypothetical protein K435DRAFT_929227 [Dendrothele bispora CBS 962.96]
MSTTIYDNMSTVDDTTYTVIIMHNIPSIVSIWSSHGKGCVNKMQLIAIVALFVFATLGFISSCIFSNLYIKISIALNTPKEYFLAECLSAIISTLYVLIKCYKIWGANKKIIVLPVFISIINNASFMTSLQLDAFGGLGTRSPNFFPQGNLILQGILWQFALNLESCILWLLFLPWELHQLSSLIFLWDSVHTLVINVMPAFSNLSALESVTIYANMSTIMVFQANKAGQVTSDLPGSILVYTDGKSSHEREWAIAPRGYYEAVRCAENRLSVTYQMGNFTATMIEAKEPVRIKHYKADSDERSRRGWIGWTSAGWMDDVFSIIRLLSNAGCITIQ